MSQKVGDGMCGCTGRTRPSAKTSPRKLSRIPPGRSPGSQHGSPAPSQRAARGASPQTAPPVTPAHRTLITVAGPHRIFTDFPILSRELRESTRKVDVLIVHSHGMVPGLECQSPLKFDATGSAHYDTLVVKGLF